MSGRVLAAAVAAPIAAFLTLIGGLAVIFGGGGSAACTVPVQSALTTTGLPPPTIYPRSALTLPSRPFAPLSTSQPAPGSAPDDWPDSLGVDGFDGDQLENAVVIVVTGAQLGVPLRGWIIAVATAIQESGLRNLTHSDSSGPDSLGLFQQRDDWGSRTARLDPAKAATMFYLGGARGEEGLLDVPQWQDLPLADAAHAVQHSADPTAYAGREDDATRLVAAITGMTGDDAGLIGQLTATSCAQPAGPAAAQAVAFARQQIGVPYKWGGNGQNDGGWDCSGLTTAAYAAGGITLPRTAQAQYDRGPHLAADAVLAPGDLVFFGTGPSRVTHVGIYAGDDTMIDAPHAGADVRAETYRWPDYIGAARPAS